MDVSLLTQLARPPLFSLLMRRPEDVGASFVKVGLISLFLAAATLRLRAGSPCSAPHERHSWRVDIHWSALLPSCAAHR